jgi:hypothetical protein
MQQSERVGAILSMWHPGQHGAKAVAEILFGRLSPSGGHLPDSQENCLSACWCHHAWLCNFSLHKTVAVALVSAELLIKS